MEALPSTKPYLIRAIWEWCCDHGYTPYISVYVDKRTKVPRPFVKDGQIVLNLGPDATNKLNIGNDFINFQARFGGVAQDISVPVSQVAAIYARENGAGMVFDLEEEEGDDSASEVFESAEPFVEPPSDPEPTRPEPGRPKLQRIK